MAELGAVSWQFKRTAVFSFPSEGHDQDAIFELAVEAGADDVTFDAESIEIVGPVESFKDISVALHEAKITPEEAGLKMVPDNPIELPIDETLKVYKMIENLEELDDVQEVFSNLDLNDEALAALEAA
jgi:transcriptional/translational regulatory protein YebC/TACO1